jgi:hypothetical protein
MNTRKRVCWCELWLQPTTRSSVWRYGFKERRCGVMTSFEPSHDNAATSSPSRFFSCPCTRFGKPASGSGAVERWELSAVVLPRHLVWMCRRSAAQAADDVLRVTYLDLARRWRIMAHEAKSLERKTMGPNTPTAERVSTLSGWDLG